MSGRRKLPSAEQLAHGAQLAQLLGAVVEWIGPEHIAEQLERARGFDHYVNERRADRLKKQQRRRRRRREERHR